MRYRWCVITEKNIKKQRRMIERRSSWTFQSQFPCQLTGFRTHLIEESRGGCLLEMKVGNTENTSAKERRETVEKRARYEVSKMARWNRTLKRKPVLGYQICWRRSRVLIQYISVHGSMVRPNAFGRIGWSDDNEIYPLKVILCVEFICRLRICKW